MKQILNIRIDERLKEQIELEAKNQNLSTSEYTRIVLVEYFDFYEEGDMENMISGEIIIDVSTPFHTNKEYLLLVAWLYSKVVNPYVYESNQQLESTKQMLELAMKDEAFSNEFRFELLKVLNDLNNYLYQPCGTGKQFWFCYPNNLHSLDCIIMYNEICRIHNLKS